MLRLLPPTRTIGRIIILIGRVGRVASLLILLLALRSPGAFCAALLIFTRLG